MLQEILEYLKKSGGSPTSIAKSDVAQWMVSDDPEVMGAVYRLVSDASLVERIMPVLPFNEIFAFLLRYYEFCLRNDPQGNWVDDRFSAACDFVSAFVSFWDDGRDKKYFQEMKSLLGRLYTEGPGERRTLSSKPSLSTCSRGARFEGSSATGATTRNFDRPMRRESFGPTVVAGAR